MGKYVQGVSEATNDAIVAMGGLDKPGLTGAYRGLAWTKASHSFAGNTAAVDEAQWNTAIAAGDVIQIGNGEFTDNSTDATFFERAALNIRIKQTPKTKVLTFEYAVNACTRAELQNMEGKAGRVFLITEKSILIGRKNDDGTVQGMPLSSIDIDDVEPTTDSPVKFVQVTMTFDDPEGDTKNPFQAQVDWDVEDLDQVFSVASVVANESSNGTTLTAEFTLTDGLANTDLDGAVSADFKAEDEDGNALTIASVTPGANPNEHVYTIDITTALTRAYVSFDGIRSISSVLYYLQPTLISV